MRLGTANIKNFPDMVKAKVVADGKTMASLTDMWGQQENNPDEDDPAIMQALGTEWAIAHGSTDVPVYYKHERFRVTGMRTIQMPFKPELPLTPRPRLLTGTTFALTEREGVPPWVVINCHLIAGAYNGDNAPADTKRRKRQWDIEWGCVRSFVEDYKRKGLTVFLLGDFNHPRPPKPTANWQWLVGTRLDRIGVTTTGSVHAEEVDDGTTELNSDHHGQWTRVILSKGGRA
jgi:hypothetical protein